MTNNPSPQPGKGLQEKSDKQLEAEATYQRCVNTAGGVTQTDKDYLMKMSSNPIITELYADVELLAEAEENLISEYYRIIGNFFKERLSRITDAEAQRIEAQFNRVINLFLLSTLRELAVRSRETTTARKSISLEEIIDKWTKKFNTTGEFDSLTTDQSIPTISNGTTLGIAAIDDSKTPKKPEPYQKSQTVIGLKVFSFPPAAPQAQAIPKTPEPEMPVPTTSGAKVQLTNISFGENDTKPTPEESKRYQTEPGVPDRDSTDVLPILEDPTEPNVQLGRPANLTQKTAKIGEPTPSFRITLPPKEKNTGDPWDSLLSSRGQADANSYNNPDLTIRHLYTTSREGDFSRPPERADWMKTIRNLHRAMMDSFQALKEDYELGDNIGPTIENAIKKTGTPQFRKSMIHAIHDLLTSIKDEEVRKMIVSAFQEALSTKPEFKRPIALSANMQRAHKQCGSKAPKKASTSAFTQAYDLPSPEELESLPSEFRSSIESLVTTAKELGISHNIMSGSNIRSIASMKYQDFEMMCYQTLNKLTIASESIGGKTNPATWGGQRRKARIIIEKLRKIIPAQLAILEQLLYSETVFIPTEIQEMNK